MFDLQANEDAAPIERGEVADAVAKIRAAAHWGDVAAQAIYARMCCEGRGVARDDAEGCHWYALAANSGHVEAMNMLGRCHELGRGTPANAELAAVWYRKAALGGLDWGMYNYANMLATGRGLKPDRAAAVAWYRRAAEAGHAKSMNLLGRHYEEGWEVERDPAAALDWYRRAAHGGDFRGQASYAGVLAQQGRIDEALQWLERALEAGTPSFLEKLGDELECAQQAQFRAIGTRMRAHAAAMISATLNESTGTR
jgi:TPR repeat protein